jgi:hypothetical protein
VAADLAAALRRTLRDPGPVPTDPGALVEYAGGQRALTQALSGLDHSPRSAEYPTAARGRERLSEDRRRWRTAQRRVQRLDTRQSVARIDLAPRRRIIAQARARKVATGETRGVRMRVLLVVSVASVGKPADVRRRWCPAEASPGELIPGYVVAEVLENVADQDLGGELLSYFLHSYFGELDPDVQVGDWRIWIDGTPES